MHYQIESSSTSDMAIKMVIDELNIDNDIKNGPLSVFAINSFKNLYSKDTSGNTDRYADCGAFDAINDFFAVLSINDRMIIALTLMQCHNYIHMGHEESGLIGLEQAVKRCSEIVRTKFTDILLFEKIQDHVNKTIDVIIENDWGTRSIDTEDKTYNKEQVLALHKIVYLCKIMVPLFGAIVTRAKGHPVEKHVHEMLCLPLVMPYINFRAPAERDKLLRYIRAIGNNVFKEDVTALHSGYTANAIEPKVMANFFVRKAVNYDVYRRQGKLITSLRDAILNVLRNYNKVSNERNLIESRKPSKGVMEERNESQLERDSIVSRRTADMRAITKVFAPVVVKNILEDYDLDAEVHSDLTGYVFKNNIHVNVVSQYVMQLLFCSYFGGITALNYLTLAEMASLIAAAQLYTANHGHTELTHAITMEYNGFVKDQLTVVDHTLLQGYNKSKAYTRYIQLLDHPTMNSSAMKILLQKRMTEIINDITGKQYVYHTHPHVCDLINETVENGCVIQFTPAVGEQLFKLMHDLWDVSMV